MYEHREHEDPYPRLCTDFQPGCNQEICLLDKAQTFHQNSHPQPLHPHNMDANYKLDAVSAHHRLRKLCNRSPESALDPKRRKQSDIHHRRYQQSRYEDLEPRRVPAYSSNIRYRCGARPMRFWQRSLFLENHLYSSQQGRTHYEFLCRQAKLGNPV